MEMNNLSYSHVYCPGFNISSIPNDSDTGSLLHDEMPDTSINGVVLFNLSRACNCSQWYQDTQDSTQIAALRIITSVISIIGSASIILSVLLKGKLNKAEVHPLFILSVADFILSILWMIGGIVWLAPGEGGWAGPESDPHTGMCYVLGVATTMSSMITFFLTLVYAQNALIRILEVYSNNGKQLNEKDNRKKIRYCFTVGGYICSWVLPLFIVIPPMEAIVGIEKTNKGCWCILDFFNLRPDDGLGVNESHFNQYAIIHAAVLGSTFIVTSILIVILYTLTFVFATRILRLQEDDLYTENGRSKKIIKAIIWRLSAFVVIFLISGLPTFAAAIDIWGERDRLHLNEPIDRGVLYIHALLSPLQGFLNAIVYGWSRKEFRKALTFGDRFKVKGRRGYDSMIDRGEYSSKNSSLNLNHAHS